jgi:hypothetical protein
MLKLAKEDGWKLIRNYECLTDDDFEFYRTVMKYESIKLRNMVGNEIELNY